MRASDGLRMSGNCWSTSGPSVALGGKGAEQGERRKSQGRFSAFIKAPRNRRSTTKKMTRKRNGNPNTSDQTLLMRFRRGDADAATALYLRYAKRLRALAQKQTAGTLSVRMDPDDVVQTVFRTFFRRAATGHYQIPDGEELWKLFLVIALNKIR